MNIMIFSNLKNSNLIGAFMVLLVLAFSLILGIKLIDAVDIGRTDVSKHEELITTIQTGEIDPTKEELLGLLVVNFELNEKLYDMINEYTNVLAWLGGLLGIGILLQVRLVYALYKQSKHNN